MEREAHPPGATDTNQLHGIRKRLSGDLIEVSKIMRGIEKLNERRLHRLGLLNNHFNEVKYFWTKMRAGHIEDDHTPFLQR
eukprot:g36092.t1